MKVRLFCCGFLTHIYKWVGAYVVYVMTKVDGFRCQFKKSTKESTEWFGSISVESGTGSINTEHHRFNVAGNKRNEYPTGIVRPEHGDPVPDEVWVAAVKFLNSLERGEDY